MKARKGIIYTNKTLRIAGISVFLVSLLAIAYSVGLSGIGYMYDADEIARVQEAYLIGNGYIPFRDYYTIYSPIFMTLLVPVFKLQGYTFWAIDTVRYLMVILFFVRVGLMSVLAAKLIHRWAGYVFAALYMLDPFVVFANMQIRPDNFMMFLLAVSLLFLTDGFIKENTRKVMASGVLLTISFIIMVKSFPTIVALSGIFLFFSYRRKFYTLIFAFLKGVCIAAAVYCIPFMLNGSFFAMIQQSILDPAFFLSSVDYPTHISFFYGPDNWYMFGNGGKPLNWVYVWFLPVLAFAGAYQAILAYLTSPKPDKKSVLMFGLSIALAAQWVLLFKLTSTFIQYFIPVLWLFAFFTVYMGFVLFGVLEKYPVAKYSILAVVFIFYLALVKTSYTGNINRSKLGSGDYITLMNKIWSYVPPDAKIFPITLFRPIGYPLAEGYFAGVHSGLLNRYDPVEIYLEKERVPYVLVSDYDLGYLSSATQQYIRSKYVTLDADLHLMVRKGSIGQTGQGL